MQVTKRFTSISYFTILFFSVTFLSPSVSKAQISGKVFRDFNANGVLDANETGIGGVTVRAYDDNDPIAAPTAITTTASGTPVSNIGSYSLTGLTAGVKYRVEFSWSTSGTNNLNFLKDGAAGGTSIQFVTNGTSNVNLGINADGQYCPSDLANLGIATTCAISGDPFAVGNNSSNDGILVRTEYLANGTTPTPTYLATAGQVGGFLFGVANDASKKRIFSANTLKRHTSFGPDRNHPSGAGQGGAIYMTNLNAALPNASVYIDLVNDLSINIGQALIPSNGGDGGLTGRGLPAIKGNASRDSLAFAYIGKMGLGDIDISDDGSALFVVNLFDRRVYQIPTADVDNGAPYSFTVLPDFPNFNGCTNGVARPYGLTFHDGDLFLGVVCTGELNTTTNTNADLVASVYRYDLNNSSGGGWSTAISFPLTYPKGFAFYNETGTNQWYNWTDTWQYTNPLTEGSNQNTGTFGGGTFRNQPILSDIEFDEDGSMILGFMDRSGNQFGHRNSYPTAYPDPDNFATAVTGGDILRTYFNPNTGLFELENAGVAGPYTSSGTGTTQRGAGGPASNQGPGGGEFFWGDFIDAYNNGSFDHSELSNGGLGICTGTREVVLSAFDPLDELDAGGYIVLDDKNGSRVRSFQLYIDPTPTSGTSGKANGVGDIEFMTGATPIEIGNYVWNDADSDGVQDPSESGIDGVVVKLFKNGSQIASTTTSGGGRYGFSNAPSGSASGFAYNISQLEANMNYEIRIENVSTQPPLSTLSLTTADNGGSDANADLRDSDGSLVSTYVVKAFTTGQAGANNHSYDFGFKVGCVQPSGLAISKTAPTCAGNDGKITLTAISSADKFGVSTGTSYAGTVYASATALGVLPQDLQTAIPNTGGTYTIRFFNNSDACFKDTTVTIAAVPTPTTPSVPASAMNTCPSTTVNLTNISSALTPSVSGGVFEWHTTNASNSPLVSNQSAVSLGTYYLFEKSPSNCFSSGAPLQVQIQTCCPTSLCLPITITRNNP